MITDREIANILEMHENTIKVYFRNYQVSPYVVFRQHGGWVIPKDKLNILYNYLEIKNKRKQCKLLENYMKKLKEGN